MVVLGRPAAVDETSNSALRIGARSFMLMNPVHLLEQDADATMPSVELLLLADKDDTD